MTNRAPFKHKQGRAEGAPGLRKLQGHQIDGEGGGGVRALFFNFAPGRQK